MTISITLSKREKNETFQWITTLDRSLKFTLSKENRILFTPNTIDGILSPESKRILDENGSNNSIE